MLVIADVKRPPSLQSGTPPLFQTPFENSVRYRRYLLVDKKKKVEKAKKQIFDATKMRLVPSPLITNDYNQCKREWRQ